MDKYYITTAIAYSTAKPHIGNVYEIVLSDAIARYHRLINKDVYFQTGVDEHGQKIQRHAIENNISPQLYVDNYYKIIKEQFDLMNVSYDNFVRTTNDYHKKQVAKIFEKLYKQGDIYKSEYQGKYCIDCESFFTISQLKDGCCPDCNAKVEDTKEEAYFFKISKYTQRLKQHIIDNPNFIQPESRKNEMLNNFINKGLEDLCVTRSSFTWSIPVPFDTNHVIYVWIDALSNYITGIGYDADGNHQERYLKYWPADVHIIGKDILRFHTIYWPILLLALDIPLPKQVFGHPWILIKDGKISKSKGNSIYVDELLQFFSIDAIRYIMLHEIPYAQDGNISYELIIERINSELVNTLGNLVNRTITMSNKYFDGYYKNTNIINDLEKELASISNQTIINYHNSMNKLMIQQALDNIFTLLRRCNKYIDQTTPWLLIKQPDKLPYLNTVLYHIIEVIKISAILLKPFMPDTANNILKQINVEDYNIKNINFYTLKDNKVTESPTILFERINPEELLNKIQQVLNNNQ